MRQQLSKYDIRLEMLKECQSKIDSFNLEINLPKSLKDSLVGSYDNLQNDHKLTSIFKESIFTARELIDLIIHRLAYDFKGTVAKDFTKFMIGISNGNYSKLDSKCLEYLSNKGVIRGFITIRNIRNKMKKDLDLTFHCLNKNNLEITLELDVPHKLRDNITNFDEIMNIKNRSQVTDKNQIIKLQEKIFPSNFIKDMIMIFEELKTLCDMK